MSSSNLVVSSGSAVTGLTRDIFISSTDVIPGRKVLRVVGLVRGNSVRARHVGVDILATMKNIVGGEIREYTKLLGESREQALDRMADEAKSMGANAVVGMRFSTSMVMGGAAELLAYGTAVELAPE